MSWFGVADRQEKTWTPPARGAVTRRGVLQRKCSCETGAAGGGCEECKKKREEPLRRSARSADDITQVPPIVFDVLRSPGQPLDTATRAFFEPRFEHDFSRVRVHTDALANRSADAVNAQAYTVGPHIVFGPHSQHTVSTAGRELLAHELTHTLQQGQVASVTNLRIGRPSDVEEREARHNERTLLSSMSPVRVGAAGDGGTLRARGPAVARPPVRAPIRPGTRHPRYASDPYDNSLEAIFRRAARARAADQARWELEHPVATLTRGGKAPDFVTKGSRQEAMFEWGNVTYEPHRFHILDAIEHAVDRATTDEDLMDVLEEYIPSPIDAVFRSQQSFRVPRVRLGLRAPIIPSNLDARGHQRMRAYQKALRRRTKTVPSLGKGRAAPAPTRVMNLVSDRGCTIRPIRGLGGDPLATLYCQAATNTIFSYWIESPVGRAEIDALRGTTWYECKCGYASLVRAIREGRRYAPHRLSALDEQVLRHSRIAAHCGLTYRFIASNEEFADFLRNRWFSVAIDVVRFEPCD